MDEKRYLLVSQYENSSIRVWVVDCIDRNVYGINGLIDHLYDKDGIEAIKKHKIYKFVHYIYFDDLDSAINKLKDLKEIDNLLC
jgi:hypothetical protein